MIGRELKVLWAVIMAFLPLVVYLIIHDGKFEKAPKELTTEEINMKGSKFTVGDYVYSSFSKEPCMILCIDAYDEGYASVKVNRVVGTKDLASLSPIPLTGEILEKNGFVHKDKLHDEFGHEVKGQSVTLDFDMTNDEKNAKLKIWLCISTSNPNDGLMPHRYFEGYIEYVHELQHALRLCNVDLQIEL